MSKTSSSETLSNLSKTLTWVTAGVYILLALPIYLAPNWAAGKFLWNVSPFLAMTIGAWYLGAGFAAWRAAVLWRWSLVRPAFIFLWGFGLMEAFLLIAFRNILRLDSWLAVLYIAALVIGSISAIVGIVDWLRTRPVSDQAGPSVPVWERFVVLAFLLFAGYISIPLLTGAARGGSIWPGELSELSSRGFGAFYFAITLSGIPGLFTRNITSVQSIIPFSIAGAAFLLIPAFVYIDSFDFQAQPGGLVYIGTYLAVIVGATIIYFLFRASQNKSAARS
ncbi:MAG: hypothetical protein HND47_11510 [Chloroflexi bacterium]|nr:hypothetical protein [Chloroflexota bacterium]